MSEHGCCFFASALPWGAYSEGGTGRMKVGNDVKLTQPTPGAQHRGVMRETTWQSV